MKTIYTEAALSEMEAFKARQQELLEQLISERKFVIGDDVLEITASDIKSAAMRIRVYRPSIARRGLNEFVTRSYVIVGLIIMVGSYFYPNLLELYQSNRTQATIFFTGAAIATMGAMFGTFNNLRRRKLEADVLIRGYMRERVEQRNREIHAVGEPIETLKSEKSPTEIIGRIID